MLFKVVNSSRRILAWRVTQQLPHADIYVMKAAPTTLRAAGSDPNNPKVLAVNLQKAQMVAMIVALINSRNTSLEPSKEESEDNVLKQKVYFLRPTLPYRYVLKTIIFVH
ncbi:hypothetical protein HF086_000960 [Spodoptera exigua]|uniref:Uncharacterized protein n=1 Tax=Spodoptera exigua TaxID=7107 RepID=A0A922MLF4_SPOEX|nr:hypothetical protein HF086_000960 [Spodoptera exigua]